MVSSPQFYERYIILTPHFRNEEINIQRGCNLCKSLFKQVSNPGNLIPYCSSCCLFFFNKVIEIRFKKIGDKKEKLSLYMLIINSNWPSVKEIERLYLV